MGVGRLASRFWRWATRAEQRTAAHRAALLADQTPWDVPRIAAELDVSKRTVRSWALRQRLAADAGQTEPDPLRLPAPEPGGYWRAGEVRAWAVRRGSLAPARPSAFRMSAAGFEPVRIAPPGRPRVTAALPEPTSARETSLAWRLRYVLGAGAALWTAGAIWQRHLFIALPQLLADLAGAVPTPW